MDVFEQYEEIKMHKKWDKHATFIQKIQDPKPTLHPQTEQS